jgi:CheY-like chemotaxis protein
MVTTGGQLLLILTSRDARTAAQLAQASGLSAADTLRQLQQLLDEGFVVVGDDTDVRVYRLTPKRVQADAPDLHPHVLLVEDDLVVRELVTEVLEEAGYAVIAATVPVDAVALLERLSFDLVITDGFSKQASAIFTRTHDVLQEARVTPVALFSAHTLELEQARAAGFATPSPGRSRSTRCSGRSECWLALDAPSAARCASDIASSGIRMNVELSRPRNELAGAC